VDRPQSSPAVGRHRRVRCAWRLPRPWMTASCRCIHDYARGHQCPVSFTPETDGQPQAGVMADERHLFQETVRRGIANGFPATSRGRVAPMHCCIGAPSDPNAPLVAAYGQASPGGRFRHRATLGLCGRRLPGAGSASGPGGCRPVWPHPRGRYFGVRCGVMAAPRLAGGYATRSAGAR
jgi:hypothetical protein